ncbi:hypothetical protein MKEN_01348900 [Mycena kentingensis (nom. inval.)]|nr:hypothetical protein MKEN_01348900 [Mycena kentingensis (nom. inval.)]
MPLFNSHNETNKLEKRAPGGVEYPNDYAASRPVGGTAHHDPYLNSAPGVADHTGTVGMGEPGMGAGRHHVPGMRNDELTGGPTYAPGTGMGAAGGPAIPPAHTVNTTADTTGTHVAGKGSSTTGKIEHAIGSIVGSKSLKAKGLQKEEEARALKVQSSELAEAERLEREATMRRERAVAHGAHPENRHLGGGGVSYD